MVIVGEGYGGLTEAIGAWQLQTGRVALCFRRARKRREDVPEFKNGVILSEVP